MDLHPLSEEEQWSLTLHALRTATTELCEDVRTLIVALPGLGLDSRTLTEAVELVQRLGSVPWDLLATPEGRLDERAVKAGPDLHASFLAGRMLASRVRGYGDPVLTMRLYHGFDHWHNAPCYLDNVPKALAQDWVDDALLPLLETARARRIAEERAMLLSVANDATHSSPPASWRRFRRI